MSHEEIARRYPAAMKATASFDARAVREVLLARGGPDEAGFVRFAYRPFDNRWLYWEADSGLLDRPRADYRPHVFEGNEWLVAQQKPRREWSPPQAIAHIGCIDLMDRSATCIPAWLRDSHIGRDSEDDSPRNPEAWPPAPAARGIGSDTGGPRNRPNLSAAARRYLDRLGLGVEDLFHHVLATLHDPAYREANAGALRMEWPRIPLPGWPAPGTARVSSASTRSALPPTPAGGTPALPGGVPVYEGHEPAVESAFPGNAGVPPASEGGFASPDRETTEAMDALARSAARGRQLAALLDPDTPVPGVTTGALRPEIAAIAVPATTDGRNMTGQDFALTAGWGHIGAGGAVMPGQGRVVERAFTADERGTLSSALPALGETTFDVYLNDRAFWRNVPAAVWSYKLGGYQVLKKWLSYRERGILERPLRPEEVGRFTHVVRRIAAIATAFQQRQRK